MSSRLKLTGIALAAAFALAACGGGGGGTTATMPPDTTEPAPPAGPTAESIKADAADAITDAVAAGMAAVQAEKDAIKYADMLDTASVSGESAMATANAQKVLDAEMAANQAVMDADDALTDAMAAKTAAEALPEDDEGRASAIAAAEEAIRQATAQKEAAMAIVAKTGADTADEVDSVKEAVAAVRGTNMDMPNNAEHHGQVVAMAIGAALGPTGPANGAGTRVTHTASPTIPDMGAVQMDDHQGMTWAEIVGAENVSMKRLGAENAEVPVALIAGMVAANSIDSFNPESLPTATGAAGDYMGIPGRVYCLGDDCKVDDDGNLTGSWYFSPTWPKVFYEKVGDATDYTPETNYARYGHWLVVDSGTGEATVNTYAASGVAETNTAGLDVTTVNREPDATELTDAEATYRGTAVGMSLHKAIDAQGNAVKGSLSSGAFMAKVRLTAKFDATSPMLGGMIYGFTSVNGGNNVDPSWSVKLTDTAFTGAAVSAGVADATGQDGTWSAQGYGASGGRPTGIYGGFNAHFTDGHAAGAYATRKAE